MCAFPFCRGAQLLRKESLYFDMFPLFFCLLWRGDFKHLELPPVADREDRVAVLENLAKDLSTPEEDSLKSRTETAKFRLFETCDVDIEESYLMKRVLRGLTNLKVLTLWWAADDAMLNIVGSVCPHLEALDLWRASAVTDLGVKMLLTRYGINWYCRAVAITLSNTTPCTICTCQKSGLLDCYSFSILVRTFNKDFFCLYSVLGDM